MQLDEIRTNLTTLKMYMNKLDAWVSQASSMIHEIEERIMDLEHKKYKESDRLENIYLLNRAATLLKCPPRNFDRCGNHFIAADGFYQRETELNKVV